MTDSTHTYHADDIVRVKSTRHVVRIESINDNPNYAADDETWADAWGEYGSVDIGSPDEIEPHDVKTPEAKDVVGEIASSLHSGFGDHLEVHETEVSGEDIIVSARHNGIPVSFTLRVVDFDAGL